MLIVIGSDGISLNDKVAKRFGHAEYYIKYDTETNKFEAIKNNDEDHTHSELENMVDEGVEVFIVGNVGPHAFDILNESGTEVYLARKMTIEEAIDNYKSQSLQKLTEPTVKKSINHA